MQPHSLPYRPAFQERFETSAAGENDTIGGAAPRLAGSFERESRNYHFNALLRSMLSGYWEWDLTNDHFFASPSLKALLGITPRQAIEVSGRCPEFICSENARAWRQAVTRLLTDRRRESVEELSLACALANGNERTLRLRMSVIDRDSAGAAVRIGGCFLDAGEPAEAVAPDRFASAPEPMRFISAVSHEIRTPLMSILGVTQLLREDDPRDDQMENLEALRFAGTALLSLVNDVLDLSKAQSGGLHLETEEFNVQAIVSSVLDAFTFQKRRKNIELALEVQEGIPANMRGDSKRLSQMLFNLVGNAVKFTSKGTVKVTVSLVLERDDEATLRFDVADTGTGIREEDIDDLFEAFGKASQRTNREFGGTGLGLTITKHLSELQNGRLTCESTLGKGSIFSLEIPYRHVERRKPEQQWQSPFRYRPLRGRVLLVEDNIVITKITRTFLEKWRVDVSHAASGEQALEAFIRDDFDLILMDLQLPGIGGWETSNRIRRMEAASGRHVPIITMTASIPEDSRDKLKEAGMDDLLLKPVHPQQMYQAVARHLCVRA